MNIIYVHSHDTGRYLSVYDPRIKTPAFDAFASMALTFRQCYCNGPTCSPSRAALLTGVYPHMCGMLGLAHLGFSVDPEKHVANVLKGYGYSTVLCGVQHEIDGARVAELGYEQVYCSQSSDYVERDKETTSQAVKFLEERDTNKPFFLSVGYFSTHRPFPEREEIADFVPDVLQDSLAIRRDFGGYLKSVQNLDRNFEKLLEAIRSSDDLLKSTMILYTTDHGIAFPEMKCHLTGHGTGVSLMIALPDGRRRGEKTDRLVSHVDVFPTLLKLLGEKTPPWMVGKPFDSVFDSDDRGDGAVFSEINYHVSYQPQRSIRTSEYNYICDFGQYKKLPPSNTDDGISKEVYRKSGYFDLPCEREYLYDLTRDPLEQNNLVKDCAYADVLREMRERLRKMMIATGDPLTKEEVIAAPEGAKYLGSNAYSAAELKS